MHPFTPKPALPNRTLINLRWCSIGMQVAAMALAGSALDITLPWAPLLTLVLAQLVVNAAATARIERHEPRELAAFMLADIAAFTGLLHFTGGPFNPFSFLYLVPIALAVLTLGSRWAWLLVAASLAGYGSLFLWHQPMPGGHSHHAHHGGMVDLHMQGMWLAFLVAACFIVYFSDRVRRALLRREEALAEARLAAAQREKLVSLATLAAGAAHELATPLATIAVVARELELQASDDGLVEDAQAIREQVQRCKDVLARLAYDAGQVTGEQPNSVPLGSLLREALEDYGAGKLSVQLADGAAEAVAAAPAGHVRQAVRALVDNALAAHSGATSGRTDVQVRASATGDAVQIDVIDDGPGMTAEVLQRATDPFFTTRQEGQGMGLGLYLARSIADALGGTLELRSRLGEGVHASLRFPRAPVVERFA